ncbi:hypothetical protein [Dactylosporangium sp. NPDC005555]|uniref:hypothetical protein n=1 Tax=Dactylosporangium sp. NPDC005555 TaxID=3154889 RepID=UPI0033A04DCE
MAGDDEVINTAVPDEALTQAYLDAKGDGDARVARPSPAGAARWNVSEAAKPSVPRTR